MSLDSAALLVSGKQNIFLDPEATELLVGYLQVIRAYFGSFHQSRQVLKGLFEQVIASLAATQQQPGKQVLTNQDISDLIQELGCLEDWKHQYAHLE